MISQTKHKAWGAGEEGEGGGQAGGDSNHCYGGEGGLEGEGGGQTEDVQPGEAEG